MFPEFSHLILWSIGVFVITASVLLLLPVEIYEKAKQSNLSVVAKGRFAYTVESLYQIKTKGFEADGKYWFHITWFTSAVSVTASTIFVFGILIICAIFTVIIVLLVIKEGF